jgi:hypothetical protein
LGGRGVKIAMVSVRMGGGRKTWRKEKCEEKFS